MTTLRASDFTPEQRKTLLANRCDGAYQVNRQAVGAYPSRGVGKNVGHLTLGYMADISKGILIDETPNANMCFSDVVDSVE